MDHPTYTGMNTTRTLTYELCKFDELESSDIQAWDAELQRQPLRSPFLSPAFVSALSLSRASIHTLVVRQGAQLVGVLPVDIIGNRAHALGRNFADFQGLLFWSPTEHARDLVDNTARALAPPLERPNAKRLLHAARVRTLHFDHCIPCSTMQEWKMRACESPFIDLSQGYAEYEAAKRKSGSSVSEQVKRKRRKLAKEVGELRFQFETADSDTLGWILKRKQEQRALTQTFDILRFDWIVDSLRRLQHIDDPTFSAVTCGLYAGDRLAAAHFSLRYANVLHYWFCAFDPDLGKYSPGLLLLMSTAEELAQLGVNRIDLGKGDERYKHRLANGSTTIWEGVVDANPLTHCVRRYVSQGLSLVRSSEYSDLLKRPFRRMRNARLSRLMRG